MPPKLSALLRRARLLGAHAMGRWGTGTQMRMFQEELCEAAVAVNHVDRGRAKREDLASEIADVLIMSMQAGDFAGWPAVKDAMSAKLDRLEAQLAEAGGKGGA